MSKSLHDAIQTECLARQKLREDEEKRKSDEQQAKIDECVSPFPSLFPSPSRSMVLNSPLCSSYRFHRNLRNEHDWTEAETAWLGARLFHHRAPRTVPDDDPAGASSPSPSSPPSRRRPTDRA